MTTQVAVTAKPKVSKPIINSLRLRLPAGCLGGAFFETLRIGRGLVVDGKSCLTAARLRGAAGLFI
jgi:hypothetical protein